VLVSLYNVVMPHKSLRQGHTPRTPAMAIGLTDHVWSSRESIWLPVHADPALAQQLDERIRHRPTPALQDQPSVRKQTASPAAESRGLHEEEGGTMPKAA
jgi:hypothetical protein